jgi:hypothetical protein
MGHSRRWLYRALYLNGPAMHELAAELGMVALPRFTRNRLADRELIDILLSLHRGLETELDPLAQRELLIDSFGKLFERH